MNTLLASRVKNAPRSFTRKILDVIDANDIISFAGGLPDEDLFPHELIKQEANNVFDTHSKHMYQYSSAQGSNELRIQIAQKYASKDANEILVTTGSQQALDLLCKAFIDEGDTIVVERPSYLAALNLFALYNPNIQEVSLTCKGVDTKELEEIFQTKHPKFFYTIPTFQNPTGWTWDNECKKEVANLAKKYNVLIIEDGPYNDLCYEGEKQISFDELIPELCVTLGTFSKTMVPDFRIGWMKAKEELIKVFQSMKENTDLQSPKFFQNVVANVMKSGELTKHVQNLILSYKEKRDTMANTLEKEFAGEISFEKPKGGMFLWIKFPKNVDTMKLFDYIIKEGVAYVPGSVFFPEAPISPYARLNYTNATIELIEEGVKRLKKGYDEYKKTL